MRKRDFSDKTVLITGAAGGLGTAFACRFGKAGARLALLDLNTDGLSQLADRLNGMGIEALTLRCDVTKETSCRNAIAETESRFHQIDVLINNAGITHSSLFAETDSAVLRQVIEVNLFGSIYCTKVALPSLVRQRGQIIVMSSIAGIAPLDKRSGYTTSKHALHGLFETLRSELRSQGVSVLIVCPTFVDTGIVEAALGRDGAPANRTQATVGRVSTPDEVAEKVFRAAVRGKRILFPSFVGRLSHWVHCLCPPLYERLMSRAVRNEH